MAGAVLGFLARNWKLVAGVGAAGYAYRDEVKKKAAEAVTDPVGTAQAIVSGTQEVISTTGNMIDGTRKLVEGTGEVVGNTIAGGKQLADSVGLGGKSGGNEDGGINWLKVLGLGGGTAGALYGLSKLFGGSDKKKDNDEDSGFGFGSIFKVALVALAAIMAWKHFNLSEIFGFSSKGEGKAEPQALNGTFPWQSNNTIAAPAGIHLPSDTSTVASNTALGQSFSAAKTAQDAMNKAAGRPVIATVEGPVHEELTH